MSSDKAASTTDTNKVIFIKRLLPKKGPDTLSKFKKCLENTADDTGHEYILEEIIKAERKRKTEKKRKARKGDALILY